MYRTLVAFVLLVPGGFALAQGPQPYAGMERRAVKALSQQQIGDLKAGRGMGLALPAELNGYPGPTHVLEHADALKLTPQQRARTRDLINAMKAEAISVGERLIEQETKLDRLFASRKITPDALAATTAEIGKTQAKLREARLKYHLVMMGVITPEQVASYRSLRGYAEHGHVPHHKMHR